MTTPPHTEYRNLVKFLLMSSFFLFVGTVHGVLQVLKPIRAWLDSIGSPYGGPGHMIDPLAHAHINVVGGVVLLVMGATYYLIPVISGQAIYSRKLVEHTFWWTTLGVCAFYSTLMTFGIIEGQLSLTDPARIEAVHHFYGPIISVASTAMGMGFWIYFWNIYKTARLVYRARP